MQISKISSGVQQFQPQHNIKKINQNPVTIAHNDSPVQQVPLKNNYLVNVSFKAFTDPNRTVADMEFENYAIASETTKRRYRKLYENFYKTRDINRQQLFNPKNPNLPLRSEHNMDAFIKTSRNYIKYKDQPIFCLGRSPKWFLNAALWMKDGIPDYKFIAFSKSWYLPNKKGGVDYVPEDAPTPKEVAAYRKYLKRIKADPQSIVDNFEKTGKRTVITDYICSGKGACSFLEVMANYAQDLGILDKFAKAIQFVGIGSLEYLEDRDPYLDEIDIPRVPLPKPLWPYREDIEQTYYDMDYGMFKEMLLNQNTNECRSTYYPHDAWTVYKPDTFKTGMVKNMKKVKELLKELKDKKYIVSFTPAMADYRNLVNFRILDALNERGLLKAVHRTKL